MGTRGPLFANPVAEFAAALLARPEAGPRAQVVAAQIVNLLPGSAVVLYVIEDANRPAWTCKARYSSTWRAASCSAFFLVEPCDRPTNSGLPSAVANKWASMVKVF